MGKTGSRADFSSTVRKLIAERAGYQCSVLNCGKSTVGPGRTSRQVVNMGMAAHIYAASSAGPRGTGGLSEAERSEPENGIWCCYSHGKAIDSDSGEIFSAIELQAWKRLHEARKGAEIHGVPHDRFGLVESISVESSPGVLAGRKFELGMRNFIIGSNGTGKSILTRLIASVAYPDHIADLSRYRNVDMEVRWFDPETHHVASSGRSGKVAHRLDGHSVPYVARPYKAILLNHQNYNCLDSVVHLAQTFDLSRAAMEATLGLLSGSSQTVKEVRVSGDRIDWALNHNGRTSWSSDLRSVSGGERSAILVDLIGAHARHHAAVEPTVLILDEFLTGFDLRAKMAALDRLQVSVQHAQVVAVLTPSDIPLNLPSGWTPTVLEHPQDRDARFQEARPVEYEVRTSKLVK